MVVTNSRIVQPLWPNRTADTSTTAQEFFTSFLVERGREREREREMSENRSNRQSAQNRNINSI